jgi:lipopolysaccharide export system permease protein
MIIFRYLTKEVLNTLLAVTFILLLIFLSKELVRYLGYAAQGKIGANILFQIMGLEIPYLLALLLPLGLYLGIVLAYGRMYADSEMRVLHACGFSVQRLMSITSVLAMIVAAIVFGLSLWLNPWIASHKDKIIAHSLSTDNVLNNLMPGRFQVSSDGKRVLYVEHISRDRKQASNIFLADQGAKHDDNTNVWTVVSAARGSQMMEKKTKDRFIVAFDGFRYEGMPGQNDFKIIQFKKYAVRLPEVVLTSKRQEQEALPTSQLWNNFNKPESAAEFEWRLSMPLMVLLLGMIAIPLSQIRPRHGRYSQLVPAILIYVVYVNLLFIARNWVEQDVLPKYIGMWWVHLVMLIIGLTLILFQSGWRFPSWSKRYS